MANISKANQTSSKAANRNNWGSLSKSITAWASAAASASKTLDELLVKAIAHCAQHNDVRGINMILEVAPRSYRKEMLKQYVLQFCGDALKAVTENKVTTFKVKKGASPEAYNIKGAEELAFSDFCGMYKEAVPVTLRAESLAQQVQTLINRFIKASNEGRLEGNLDTQLIKQIESVLPKEVQVTAPSLSVAA